MHFMYLKSMIVCSTFQEAVCNPAYIQYITIHALSKLQGVINTLKNNNDVLNSLPISYSVYKVLATNSSFSFGDILLEVYHCTRGGFVRRFCQRNNTFTMTNAHHKAKTSAIIYLQKRNYCRKKQGEYGQHPID